MSHTIKNSANNIINLCNKYEKEALKTKKTQLLNEVSSEISLIEKECMPDLHSGIVPKEEKKELMKELKIKNLPSLSEEKQEKIYKLNVYGKISNFFFHPLTLLYKKIFPNHAEKLRTNLLFSGVDILSMSYISIMLFTSFLLLFLGSAIGVILFYTYSVWHGFLLGIILSIISVTTFYIYPPYATKKRRHELESEYPFIINHLASLSNTNISTEDMFRTILNSKHYKSINTDAKRIITFIALFNYSLPSALKKAASNNPSPKIRELFYELAELIEENKNPKRYLNAKAKLEIDRYYITKTTPMHRLKNLYYETFKQMHFRWIYLLSFAIGILLITLSIYYYQSLNLIAILSILIGNTIAWSPLVFDSYKLWLKNRDLELQFFYFARDLNKTKNILKLKRDYKSLDLHIKKLINQFHIGIPIETALMTFSKEIKNPLIESTISAAIEAKKHGASIYEALDQIATAKIIRNALRTEKTN
jgi:pilus assembly protein TadC